MNIFRNRTFVYWLIQIIAWGVYTLFLIFSFMAFGGVEGMNAIVSLQILIGVVLLFSSDGIRRIIKSTRAFSYSTLRLIGFTVGISLITALGAQIVIHTVIYGFWDWSEIRPFSLVESTVYWLNSAMILLIWTTIYLGIKSFERRREKEIENWRLKAELNEMELGMLKAQINPHFLFNALNNVRSLIIEDQHRAREMVSALSNLLRYAISHNNGEAVSMKKELEMVNNYLALEKIQYEDRLQTSINIDSNLLDAQIPPMTLQMLVENAIKHGIARNINGGNIEISANQNEELITLTVLNDGELQTRKNRTGLGIENISKRIKNLFGDEAEFRLNQHSENQVAANLTIPHLKS